MKITEFLDIGRAPRLRASISWGKFGFQKIGLLKPPRERPRGGGGTYRNGGMGASAPIIYLLA